MKLNCWYFKKCGRTPNGQKASELGVCPASTDIALDGIHGGMHAGRACWVVAGTLCGGKVQGHENQKQIACWGCDFFKLVRREEEPESFGFSATRLGMDGVIRKMETR